MPPFSSLEFELQGVPVQIHFDPHGVQLCVRGQSPCGILDIFEGRVQLLAFDQRGEDPIVIAKFNKEGLLTSVEQAPIAFVSTNPDSAEAAHASAE